MTATFCFLSPWRAAMQSAAIFSPMIRYCAMVAMTPLITIQLLGLCTG